MAIKIDVEKNLVTLRFTNYRLYQKTVEENKETIDNTVEFKGEYVINISCRGD